MNFTNFQIRKIKPYCPPLEERAQFQGLKLDFNERLAPLPKAVQAAISSFDPNRSLYYPAYGSLPHKIANYSKVEEKNVMVTNGSDQGIELIFRTFINAGDKVVIPSPSFGMFYQMASIQDAKIIKPRYLKNGDFPLEEVLKSNPKLLIICNPNNPTGNLIPLSTIKEILENLTNSLIYIDEAYFEFSGITAANLIKKYPNLIITRTFSKAFGLAALRIGYILSCKKNIQEMLKVRGPYDVNQFAKVAAEASLDYGKDSYCKLVMEESKPMVENFFQEKGIEFWPSGGNFLYFREPIPALYEKLKKEGVLIRPREPRFSRVSIGTPEQMEKFINILTKIL